MAERERRNRREGEYPSFNSYEEVHAYVSRLSLEAHGRTFLGESTEFSFLESPDKPFTGLVVAHVAVKGREEKVPFVFGLVDQFGSPQITLQGVPTGPGEHALKEKLAKQAGIKLS